jgi:hypothetical protein
MSLTPSTAQPTGSENNDATIDISELGRLSKPILGFQFLNKVQALSLKLESFEEEPKKNMKSVAKQISSRLKAQAT